MVLIQKNYWSTQNRLSSRINSYIFICIFPEAVQCHNKALEINPTYALAWNNKGLALDELDLREVLLYDRLETPLLENTILHLTKMVYMKLFQRLTNPDFHIHLIQWILTKKLELNQQGYQGNRVIKWIRTYYSNPELFYLSLACLRAG